MKIISVVLMVLCLAACSMNRQAILTNPEGKSIRCSSHAYGWGISYLIASSHAESIFNDCVSRYQSQGYTKQ